MNSNITIPGTEIIIEISPFELLGYEFHTLTLYEEIGGKLAQGKLTLAPKQLQGEVEDQQAVYQWNNLYISIKDYSNDISYYIFGWITRKETIEKMLCVDFVVFPYYSGGEENYCRQFLTLGRSRVHTIERQGATEGLKQLVCSLWKGPWQREPWPDIRCTSISNNLLPEYIWQRNESDYAFLNKILYSYKENSIFGYGINGLFIKDMISQDEPNKIVLGQIETTQESGFSRNFEYRLHQKHQNPWEQEENEVDTGQFSVLTHDNNYSILSKDFSAMLYNYRQNNMIMRTRFFSSFQTYTVHQLPSPKLGECVSYTQKVDGENNKEGLFINSSNQYFFANPMSGDRDHHDNIFSVTSVYRGIEDNQQDVFKDPKEVVDIFGLNKII